MKSYLKKMEQLLTEEDIEFLKKIYDPTVVAKAPSDAFHSLCIIPDGEIRCYGYKKADSLNDKLKDVYISTRDCGLSWKMHKININSIGEGVYSPYSARFISPYSDGKTGYMRIADKGGCDSTDYRIVPLGREFGAYHYPIALRSKKRWIFAADYLRKSIVFISDDDGDSWRAVDIQESDHFIMQEPHKGIRWENSGMEPAVTELSNGTLIMILRTSTDYHYISYSYDYGDSWTKPVASTFHSTLTNPELLRLSDGRTVFFYNNTRPLPEQDKDKVWPPLNEDEKSGYWEDVFTNRDSNCVTISEDDCKTWIGFRELYLNELRNTCDFRSSGSNESGFDKSVHQFQAIELPFGKIMVQVGQHELIRKIIIFDIKWLYEKKRSEDFKYGMGSISSQVYVKSVSGGFRGFTGHCAWNRTNGAMLMPDPSGDYSEVLLIKNTDDDRLVSNAQGAVWNFPASKRGVVNVSLRIMGKGIRISLSDHWINPIDLTVGLYSQFTFILKKHGMSKNDWTNITVFYDINKEKATVKQENRVLADLKIHNKAPNGLCYLHFQTISETGDKKGTYIKKFNFSAVE